MVKAVLLLIALTSMGCSSYRLAAAQPPPTTPVRVSFLSPRDVVARSPTGDSILLRNVRELRGTIASARSDSLHVRLGSAHGPSGTISGVTGGVIAAVPREVFVRVEERSFDSGKTWRWIGYVGGGALLVMLLAIALAVGSGPAY